MVPFESPYGWPVEPGHNLLNDNAPRIRRPRRTPPLATAAGTGVYGEILRVVRLTHMVGYLWIGGVY